MLTPNKITIGRIILSLIIFLLAILYCSPNMPRNKFYKYIILFGSIVIMISDFLDGYIARKYNMISNFGKITDPIADKIFILVSLIIFANIKINSTTNVILSNWIIFIIVLRDIIVTLLRVHSITLNKIIISADKLGKIKTFIQMMTIMFGFIIWTEILDITKNVAIIWNINIWILIIVTVVSGVSYIINYIQMNNKLTN